MHCRNQTTEGITKFSEKSRQAVYKADQVRKDRRDWIQILHFWRKNFQDLAKVFTDMLSEQSELHAQKCISQDMSWKTGIKYRLVKVSL